MSRLGATGATASIEQGELKQDLWIQMLYDTFSDAEIRKLATASNASVQGFSKNVMKAPIGLLRKSVTHKLNRLLQPRTWLSKWFEPAAVKYRDSDTTFEYFCQQVQVVGELTAAEVIGLTGLLYPDSFNRHADKIRENVAVKQHPLADISTKKLTFKRELQVKAGVWSDPAAEIAFQFAYRQRYPEAAEALKQSSGLKEWIRETPELKAGELAYMAALHQEAWSKWNEGEKSIWLAAALQDAGKLWMKSLLDAELDKTELDKDVKAKEKRLKRLEKVNQDWEANEAAYELRIQELQGAEAEAQVGLQEALAREAEVRALLQEALAREADARAREEELRERLELAERRAAEQESEREQLHRLLRQQEDRLEEPAAAWSGWSEDTPDPVIPEEDVLLITRFGVLDYAPYVPAGTIAVVNSPEEIPDIAGIEQCRVVFIHSDGFATKELFAMDDWIRPLGVAYRYVSGSPIGATRQIIYYLEGDHIDETHA